MKPVALYYSNLCYQEENRAYLENYFEVIEKPDPSYDDDESLQRAVIIFAPLGFLLGRDKIDRAPKLRVIASNTTGHPHIDVAYASRRHIFIACLKDESAFLATITSTAEHAFGLILAITRNTIPAHSAALQGKWDRRPFGAPAMLSRMSLGIVGLGRLGQKVANYGHVFGMRVNYFDPYVTTPLAWLFHQPSLEALVSSSDVISVHVPHESETEKMFDKAIFKLFRPGAWFINTARGELVDFNALQIALESGLLAGAALDVFEDEYSRQFKEEYAAHPLLAYARKNDNLILTPHIGGSTVDAWRKTEAHTIDMVLDALSIEKSRHQPR